MTLKYVRDIKDEVAEALFKETDYFVAEAEREINFATFTDEVWPKVKLKDGLKEKLVTVFIESFEKFMLEFIGCYIAQTDRKLMLERMYKPTTIWVKRWSAEPVEI